MIVSVTLIRTGAWVTALTLGACAMTSAAAAGSGRAGAFAGLDLGVARYPEVAA